MFIEKVNAEFDNKCANCRKDINKCDQSIEIITDMCITRIAENVLLCKVCAKEIAIKIDMLAGSINE